MADKDVDISKAFGKVIRKLRIEKGLTQAKLAELSDLHTNYISFIERGERKPTLNTVFKIASALEVNPHKLILEVEKMS